MDVKYRCKDGDLALVIHDEPVCAGNVGKIVQVRGPILFNRRLKLMCWLIKPVNRQLWHCVRGNGQHYTAVVTWKRQTEHPDAWLMPLKPDADLLAERVGMGASEVGNRGQILELGLGVHEP